ncbi:MAG TPA: hypothetical protein VIS51_02080 [Solirubrobacterales bacterium]
MGGGDATLIDWTERDHVLKLQEPQWGTTLRASWEKVTKPDLHFTRTLSVSDTAHIEIEERIVRFPSVPIYGINRKAEYSVNFSERPNMHTMRVLTTATTAKPAPPVTRVFILNNGLNETRNLRFYYQLASWILRQDGPDSRSACLVAPFPGHLMHAAFPGPFGQTPLARYLGDSGELFRQFLRYMVEMRWLLSLLVRRRPEAWRVGEMPLARANLAKGLLAEWSQLRQTSREVWEARKVDLSFSEETVRQLLGAELEEATIRKTIDVMTDVLGLEQKGSPQTMPVHVIGYSLGGFLAQSVFFAWPNIVSSCSTICSGGAIRALSPTAFAHSEEWQAVLHTLRPELEDSMLGGRISHDRNSGLIAGMDEAQFGYYQRIFDQVFLQEDNASYKARLSEYGTRMLFVSGGEDPIVRTREILDAGPDDGITMLSVANLTHFLGEKPLSDRETEQREFWLPEAGGLLARAATRAEDLHEYERREAHREHLNAKRCDELTPEDAEKGARPGPPRHRDLPSPEFEDALDWVIDGVGSKDDAANKLGEGWLFVCRNGIPAAFLGNEMHRAWGTGLHHHDVSVQRYAAGLAKRAARLRGSHDRITLLLPSGLERTFVESSGGLVDPHSDAPGYLATGGEREKAWNQFLERWGSAARWLDASDSIAHSLLGPKGEGIDKEFAKQAARWQRVPVTRLRVTHVPDVWVSVDNRRYNGGRPDEAIKTFIEDVSKILSEEPPVPLQSSGPIKAEGKRGEALERDLKEGRIRIVRVSGAELNPRYRGRFEKSFWPALTLLAHCAATLVRSGEEPAK